MSPVINKTANNGSWVCSEKTLPCHGRDGWFESSTSRLKNCEHTKISDGISQSFTNSFSAIKNGKNEGVLQVLMKRLVNIARFTVTSRKHVPRKSS